MGHGPHSSKLVVICVVLLLFVVLCIVCICVVLCIGNVVPLQVWSGPKGSRKLRFPGFMTTAQGGGKVVSLTHRPHLPLGNSPGTHFC